jgi:hypothetical protein
VQRNTRDAVLRATSNGSGVESVMLGTWTQNPL